MMTLFGTCRLVMPLRESTMASGGRLSYTAAMSASISTLLSAGSASSLSSTPTSPSLTFAPIPRSVSACRLSACS